MKLIDISQEVFSCCVYPGDRGPEMIPEMRMKEGTLYNLTSFSMCAHNGTHTDAPFHFIADGKTIDQMPLEKMMGWCRVFAYEGEMTGADAAAMLERTKKETPDAAGKILLKGQAWLSAEAAEVFAAAHMDLIGVEVQSVGPESAPMRVHQILLKEEICLLEGIRLKEAEEGVYFLCAAPLNLAGLDGAPCRATLIQP